MTLDQPFQFRLSTLLLAITACGVATAVSQSSDWAVGILAGASVCMVIGLLQQAHDLWHGRADESPRNQEAGWGWRFAVLWRAVVALTICLYWLFEIPQVAGIISPKAMTEVADFRDSEADFRTGCFYLALTISLSSMPWITQPSSRTVMARVFDILGWIAGACLAFLLLSTAAMIDVLVHIAIEGIEALLPYRFVNHIIRDVDVAGDTEQMRVFARVAFAMLGLSLLNAYLVGQLSRTPKHRFVTAVFLLGGIVGVAASAAWVHTAGLHRVSPYLAESQVLRSWPCWLFAGLLLGLFCGACSFRLSSLSRGNQRRSMVLWYRGPTAYWNESRAVMVAISVSLILALTGAQSVEQFVKPSSWHLWYEDAPACLPLAVLWLALVASFARRPADCDHEMAPVELSPLKFVATLVLVAAVTIGLVDSIAWASFALWLL